MCKTKKPPAIRQAPAVEPAKTVDTLSTPEGNAYNREQALKRGMASVWTRYSSQGQDAGNNSLADKSDTLGGT